MCALAKWLLVMGSLFCHVGICKHVVDQNAASFRGYALLTLLIFFLPSDYRQPLFLFVRRLMGSAWDLDILPKIKMMLEAVVSLCSMPAL